MVSVSNVEDVTGAAGREAEGVEQNLPGQAEDDQLVVEILLATLSDLPRPGAAALLVSLTAAHPHHLLVLRLLLLDVVHNKPPLEVGVASCPGADEGLQEVTGWPGSFLEMSRELMRSDLSSFLTLPLPAVCWGHRELLLELVSQVNDCSPDS